MAQEFDRQGINGDMAIAAALWDLGLLRSDALPFVAADALAAGQDTPALRELAGTSGFDAAEVAAPLLEQALHELGVPPAPPCAARLVVARRIAAEIVAGTVSERVGTRSIYVALGDWGDEDCASAKARWLELDDDFDRFQYDVAEHRPDLNRLHRAVKEAAAALIADS
jgi:hypothetical protein